MIYFLNILFLFLAEVTLSGSSVPLDREVRDLYSLVVTVNDGIHSTTHSFTVNVTDINDNIPSFELDAYIVQTEVLENSSFGKFCFVLTLKWLCHMVASFPV